MTTQIPCTVAVTRSSGFTLIELIIVILIIVIIAGIAVPRYIDQVATARTNSTASLAAALAAASASNFAKRSANAATGSAIANCTDIGGLLSNGLPSGYSIISRSITANSNASCTLNGLGSSSATFTGLGIA